MGSLIIIAGSIGIVCAAGTGVSAVMKWFHSFEPEFGGRPKQPRSPRGGAHHDKIENLSKRIRPDHNL